MVGALERRSGPVAERRAASGRLPLERRHAEALGVDDGASLTAPSFQLGRDSRVLERVCSAPEGSSPAGRSKAISSADGSGRVAGVGSHRGAEPRDRAAGRRSEPSPAALTPLLRY